MIAVWLEEDEEKESRQRRVRGCRSVYKLWELIEDGWVFALLKIFHVFRKKNQIKR